MLLAVWSVEETTHTPGDAKSSDWEAFEPSHEKCSMRAQIHLWLQGQRSSQPLSHAPLSRSIMYLEVGFTTRGNNPC